MGSPLIEDFSDAAAFVQEDTSYYEQSPSEDELERKIAEEHAKFKEALARRQEEVRASRPWSAPPVESPRPEQQKEREKERQARASTDVDPDAPRAEYEPPVRSYLLQAQASGNNLSYLSRPQSAEHRTAAVARSLNGQHHSRVSLSGIEEETGEGTTCDSRQASEAGRLNSTFGEGKPGGAVDDVPTRDRNGAVAEGDGEEECEEREEAREEEEEEQGQGVAGGLESEVEGKEVDAGEETDPRVTEPSAEEVAEDEGDTLDGAGGSGDVDEDGARRGDADATAATAKASGDAAGGVADAEPVDDGVLMASGEALASSLGAENYRGAYHRHLPVAGDSIPLDAAGDGDGEGVDEVEDASHVSAGGQALAEESSLGLGEQRAEEDSAADVDAEEQGEEGEGDESGGAASAPAPGAAPSVAASSTTRSMAMRGFVEPLPYDMSYHSAGRHSPGAAPQVSRDYDEEEEDYGEDTFEEDEEQGEQEGPEAGAGRPGVQPPLSGEGSLLRASPLASKALLSSSSLRSREGALAFAPPSRETSSRALSAAAPPLMPHASRTSSSAVGPDGTGGIDDDAAAAAALATLTSKASALPPIVKAHSVVSGSAAAGTSTSTAGSDAPAASARSALAASHSQRSLSSSGAGSLLAAAALAPPPPLTQLSELQPSQQFALQLLKHDIEVLPQHHRAAAEAAVAARRKSATTRPAGAGLATFGYLGYHMISEELTAPSGPAFRSISPGRAASPGRGDGGAAAAAAGGGLPGSGSLIAVRSGDAAAGAGRSSGRPTSAPHMRHTTSTILEDGEEEGAASGSGGGAGGGTATEGGDGATAVGAGFVGLARDMRAGRILPPVVPPTAPRVGRINGSNGSVDGGGGVPASERSMSVMEEDLNAAVAQNRMKFDVWLNALNNGATLAGPTVRGGDSGGSRQPRPLTAPASGRRRPVSARPGVGGGAAGIGLYTPQPALVNVPKPLIRPASAQPHHHRPASATMAGRCGNGVAGAIADTGGYEPPVPITVQPPEAASAAGGTAAVEVGGVTVSVYVADTLKRIVEANRWLQQMGVVSKRYRLKDRLSNMTVQLVEELTPLPSERAGGGFGGGAVATVKELTLKQFLSGHARLKQQAKKVRAAAALAQTQQQQQQAAAMMGMAAGAAAAASAAGGNLGPGGISGMYSVTPDFGAATGRVSGAAANGGRPFSATFGSGGGGAMVRNGGRVRPASAMPYSGVRTAVGSAGGADSSMYGGAGLIGPGGSGGGMGYLSGHVVRPSSANPAYGRASAFTSYNPGSFPPGGVAPTPFIHTAYAAQASAVADPGGGKHFGGLPTSGGPPAPRAAWSGAGIGVGSGGYPSHQSSYPSAGGRSSGGGHISGNDMPYYQRSISATARPTHGPTGPDAADPSPHGHMDDDVDSERAMVIEPDERGDVSRAVRQQLGSAAEYCQTRRQEIARLRTLPLA